MSKILRTCPNGHESYKSSDCPTCPACEKERKPIRGFLAELSAPARRALEFVDVDTIEKLSNYTEKEILKLHGMGKASLPKLRAFLATEGLTFKQ
ncbi:MAG: RNA polymerase alpha subunit C-terminal domain-containing protein [Pedobacter sp.]